MLRNIAKNLLTISLLALASPALGQFHGEWGVGLSESGVLDDGAKYIALDAPSHLNRIWEAGPEAGMVFDKRVGCKSAQFVSYKIGLEPVTKQIYFHYMLGPAYLSQTDSRLGSNFQFTHEAGIGIKDVRGVRLGFDYRHFSNAGIVMPNEGKDFIGFQMEVPL